MVTDALFVQKVQKIHEAAEQHLIEESVKLVREEKKVLVTSPFTKDPVNFLTKLHGASNNYHQAFKTYQAQCKKPDHVKAKLRETHADLVGRQFMTRLSDMPVEVEVHKQCQLSSLSSMGSGCETRYNFYSNPLSGGSYQDRFKPNPAQRRK